MKHSPANPRPCEPPLRKAIHLGMIVLPVLYAGWLDRTQATVLAAIMVLGSALVEWVRRGRGRPTRLFEACFGSAIRPEERRGFLGSMHYSLGVLATVLIFDRSAAVAGLLFLAVGDAAASMVGRPFGRVRIGRKSLEGLLAFWLSASAAAWLLWLWRPEYPLGAMLVAAPLAAAVELLSPGRLDNWSIPLAAGAIVALLA